MENIFTELPGLLSLTGKAEQRVLLYLGASNGGGVQGLLSLRLVCRTTKDWVDNLSPRFGQRVFSRVVVRVDLSKMGVVDYLKSFLESPPPSAVTSLYLCGDVKTDLPPRTSSCLKMWNHFTDYWATKLKSIEMDKFSIERSHVIRKLLGSKAIQNFRCEHLFVDKSFTVSELTEFLFSLKSLRIDRLDIVEEKREWFFNTLFANKSLRVIDHSIRNWDTINSIFRARKDEDNLKMIFRVCPYKLQELGNRPVGRSLHWVFGEKGESQKYSIQPSSVGEFVGFETFLEGVAQCKSLIEIVGLNAHDVSKAIRIFRSRFSMEANQPNYRQYKLLKLKNTQTLVIKLFHTMNEDHGQIGSFLSRRSPGHRKGYLSRAAQVDHLTSLCIWLEAYSIDFNEKLNQLAPDAVTNLSIKLINPHGSGFLVKVLNGATLNFPRVAKLEIFWDYCSNAPNNTGEHFLHEDFKQITDLKILTLNIRGKVIDENEVVNDIRDFLLGRISQLPLKSLVVQIYKRQYDDDWFRMPVVDEVFVASFLERPIGSTLCYFRVSDNLFIPGAMEKAKAVILRVTRVNKRKREFRVPATCNVI